MLIDPRILDGPDARYLFDYALFSVTFQITTEYLNGSIH